MCFAKRLKKELTALGIEPLSTQVSVNAVTTPLFTLTLSQHRGPDPTPLETLSANPATSLPIQLRIRLPMQLLLILNPAPVHSQLRL